MTRATIEQVDHLTRLAGRVAEIAADGLTEHVAVDHGEEERGDQRVLEEAAEHLLTLADIEATPLPSGSNELLAQRLRQSKTSNRRLRRRTNKAVRNERFAGQRLQEVKGENVQLRALAVFLCRFAIDGDEDTAGELWEECPPEMRALLEATYPPAPAPALDDPHG